MQPTDDQPIFIAQTTALNEAVETVLSRLEENEIFIPPYQRDSDEWNNTKKSLFIESILNRLTIPAFYLAPSEKEDERSEVIDGQQRLMTLKEFFDNKLVLLENDRCPYFGKSVHYAGLKYNQLNDQLKKTFRRYTLSLVTLPHGMPLSVRLEIFRRINEGGTPLSPQDIRLGYYSEAPTVRFSQLVGIYDPERNGSKRMIENCKEMFDWPWNKYPTETKTWKKWWYNTKTSNGQTPSQMFLWYVTSRCKDKVDQILDNKDHIIKDLNLNFRNSTTEVLDIICAQWRYEYKNELNEPNLLPGLEQLSQEYFPQFVEWWYSIRTQCLSLADVSKYRSIALLIPGLIEAFQHPNLSYDQWTLIGSFIDNTRKRAGELKIDFPESKGTWSGSRGQRNQLNAYYQVAEAIKKK
jgi:hypothetical protein